MFTGKSLIRGGGICNRPALARLPARAPHAAAPPLAVSAPRSAAAAPAPAASAAPSPASVAVGTGGTGQHFHSSPRKLKVLFLMIFGEPSHPASHNAPAPQGDAQLAGRSIWGGRWAC